MLKDLPREQDGTLRGLASEFLPGKPVGPWLYEGVRGDDGSDEEGSDESADESDKSDEPDEDGNGEDG